MCRVCDQRIDTASAVVVGNVGRVGRARHEASSNTIAPITLINDRTMRYQAIRISIWRSWLSVFLSSNGHRRDGGIVLIR
jgi:hypothetical protein